MRERGVTTTEPFGLGISMVSYWIFNCYVVTGDDGAAVVDPGCTAVAEGAAQVLANKFGHAGPETLTMTCSHGHTDHMSGMPRLAERTNAAAMLPAKCEDYIGGERARTFGLDHTVRFLPVLSDQQFSFRAAYDFAKPESKVGYGQSDEFALPETLVPAGYLGDGDALPGAAGWETISTPGHSDDSTCYYHADSATLLSGDAIVTYDDRAWFNPEWVSTSASAETEERLRSLPVEHLLPGHGLAVSGDVWRNARSFRTQPEGKRLLARCSRRFGKWNY